MQSVGSKLTASDIPELSENTNKTAEFPMKIHPFHGLSWVNHGFLMGFQNPVFIGKPRFVFGNHGLSWLNHGRVTGSSRVARGLSSIEFPTKTFPFRNVKQIVSGGSKSRQKVDKIRIAL